MAITLRPYQVELRDWLIANGSSIVGDEAGLGKSYPAIEAASVDSVQGDRNLIVCPRYLIPNWVGYLADYNFGDEDVTVVEGSPDKKTRALTNETRWTICTYNTVGQTSPKSRVGRTYPELLATKWKTIIFDEAHRMRSRHAMWTKQALVLKAQRKWLLTGSPLYNNPGDLFSLLKIVAPKTYTSFWRWAETYCAIINDGWHNEIAYVKDPVAFKEMWSPSMMRRRYEDVEVQLPEAMAPIVVKPQLTEANRRSHDALDEDYKMLVADGDDDYAAANSVLGELRKITTTDPNKMNALTELVSDINSRVVVLCWFKNTAQELARKLKTDLVITGSVDANDRQDIFDQLSVRTEGRLVATLGSMSEGLNLQHTHHVVFYEMDWNHEMNAQALARFQRPGQQHRVQSYYIVAANSVDGVVQRVAQRKQRDLKSAILNNANPED